jgi:hypothetical protein
MLQTSINNATNCYNHSRHTITNLHNKPSRPQPRPGQGPDWPRLLTRLSPSSRLDEPDDNRKTEIEADFKPVLEPVIDAVLKAVLGANLDLLDLSLSHNLPSSTSYLSSKASQAFTDRLDSAQSQLN